MKDLLPIGSIVLLKDANKKLMIIGVMQIKQDEGKMYDYLGVPYPEGYINQTNNFLFQHEDINDVVFTGYQNPEKESFVQVLNVLYNNYEKQAAQKPTPPQEPEL